MARSRLLANVLAAINGIPIGGTTPAAGAFTSLSATGTTALTGPLSSGGSAGVAGQILRSIGAGGAAAWGAGLVSGTAQSSTSGANIDFNGVIPSWARRVTVMFDGVSLAGTQRMAIQIGTSGGIEATGYVGAVTTGTTSLAFSTGFTVFPDATPSAGNLFQGSFVLSNLTGDVWVGSGILGRSGTDGAGTYFLGGRKTLSAVLDRVRISAGGGTFDAGSINIMWE